MTAVASTHANIFGALVSPAAGLSSAQAHRAADRGAPSTDNEYHGNGDFDRAIRPVSLAAVPAELSRNMDASDIAGTRPSARPLMACANLPRTFRQGSRVVNPLDPKYLLPGHSEYARSGSGGNSQGGSPRAAGSPLSPSASMFRGSFDAVQSGGGGSGGGAGTSNLGHSSSPGHLERLPSLTSAAVPGGGGAPTSRLAQHRPHPSTAPAHVHRYPPTHQQHQTHTTTTAEGMIGGAQLSINGAVGGLLLYGPGPTGDSDSWRCLDVRDINGPHRSQSVPPRKQLRDSLVIDDIVPPRHSSPTRTLNSLHTGDIHGATSRLHTHDCASPGRGTLHAGDIAGASPGRGSRTGAGVWCLGRCPMPSSPNQQFARTARITMIKKPTNVMD